MAESVEHSADADSENSAFEKEKDTKLTCYFRDLLRQRIKFQIPSKEASDIIQSVGLLIGILVAKVTSTVMWLPISRLLQVGSMAEKTSIIRPDEFDYLLVMEQSGIEITRCLKRNKGYVHVRVTEQNLNLKWQNWIDGEDYLKGAFTRHTFHLVERYFHTLGNAFMHELAKVIRKSKEDLTQHTDTGTLRVDKNVAKHGPAFTPSFFWERCDRNETFEIKVDMTVAFEVCLTPEIICKEDTFHPKIWEKVKELGKCMVIPCHEQPTSESCDRCFRLTFTETEVELVQALSQHHTDCYKLLKYIFNSGDGPIYLPSYVWKTLVLEHDCYCKENANLSFCFKSIVDKCLYYLCNRKVQEHIYRSQARASIKVDLNIPSIFVKNHNILDSKEFLFPSEQYLQSIERMLQSLEDISGTEKPGVDDIVIVNKYNSGRNLELKNVMKFQKKKKKKIYIYRTFLSPIGQTK